MPGATAMCWCDGETPGVQECSADQTFEPCVCDGSAGTGAGDGSGDAGDDAQTDGNASSGSGNASSSSGNAADGTDTGGSTTGGDNGSVDTGTGDDGPSDACTDERFAFYQACLVLADTSPSTEFYENCIATCPPTTDSCGYAACSQACTLDTPTAPDVQACRDEYPECVYAVASEDELACHTACNEQQQTCNEGATCTGQGGSTTACSVLREGCALSCEDNGVPSDGWEITMDGECSGTENLALLLCRNAVLAGTCFAGCNAAAPDCGYQACYAQCQADDLAAEVPCESTWGDCPSTNPGCRADCYADEATCIVSCVDVSPCATTRTACLDAC